MTDVSTNITTLYNNYKTISKISKVVINIAPEYIHQLFLSQPYTRYLQAGRTYTVNASHRGLLEQATGIEFVPEGAWPYQTQCNDFVIRQSIAHLWAYQQILRDEAIQDEEFVLIIEDNCLLDKNWVSRLNDYLGAMAFTDVEALGVNLHDIQIINLGHSKQDSFKYLSHEELIGKGVKYLSYINVFSAGQLLRTDSISSSQASCYLIRKALLKKYASQILARKQIGFPIYDFTKLFAFNASMHSYVNPPFAIELYDFHQAQENKSIKPVLNDEQLYQLLNEESQLNSNYDYLASMPKYVYYYEQDTNVLADFFQRNRYVEDFTPISVTPAENVPLETRLKYIDPSKFNDKKPKIIEAKQLEFTILLRDIFRQVLTDDSIPENDYVFFCDASLELNYAWRERINHLLDCYAHNLNAPKIMFFALDRFDNLVQYDQTQLEEMVLPPTNGSLTFNPQVGREEFIAYQQQRLQAQHEQMQREQLEFNDPFLPPVSDQVQLDWQLHYLRSFLEQDYTFFAVRKSTIRESEQEILAEGPATKFYSLEFPTLCNFDYLTMAVTQPFLGRKSPRHKQLHALTQLKQDLDKAQKLHVGGYQLQQAGVYDAKAKVGLVTQNFQQESIAQACEKTFDAITNQELKHHLDRNPLTPDYDSLSPIPTELVYQPANRHTVLRQSFNASNDLDPQLAQKEQVATSTYLSNLPLMAESPEQGQSLYFKDHLARAKKYVINMVSNTERLKSFRRQPHVDDFIHFHAVVGWDIPEAELAKRMDKQKFAYYFNREPTPGEIGCTLSHVEIYKQIVADDTIAPNDLVLIAEDDVILAEDWYQRVNVLIEGLLHRPEQGIVILSQVYVHSTSRMSEHKFMNTDYIYSSERAYHDFGTVKTDLERDAKIHDERIVGRELHNPLSGFGSIRFFKPCASSFYLIRKSMLLEHPELLTQPAYWYADSFDFFPKSVFSDSIGYSNPILAVQSEQLESDIEKERNQAERELRLALRKVPMYNPPQHYTNTKVYIIQSKLSKEEIHARYPKANIIEKVDFSKLTAAEKAEVFDRQFFVDYYGYDPDDEQVSDILTYRKAMQTLYQKVDNNLMGYLVFTDEAVLSDKIEYNLNHVIEYNNTRISLATNVFVFGSAQFDDKKYLDKLLTVKQINNKHGYEVKEEEYLPVNENLSVFFVNRTTNYGLPAFYVLKYAINPEFFAGKAKYAVGDLGKMFYWKRNSIILSTPASVYIPKSSSRYPYQKLQESEYVEVLV